MTKVLSFELLNEGTYRLVFLFFCLSFEKSGCFIEMDFLGMFLTLKSD